MRILTIVVRESARAVAAPGAFCDSTNDANNSALARVEGLVRCEFGFLLKNTDNGGEKATHRGLPVRSQGKRINHVQRRPGGIMVTDPKAHGL